MAISLTCTGVRKIGNKYLVNWSDGNQNEFRDAAEARQYARDILNDGNAVEMLRAFVLAKALRPGAAGTAVDNLVNTVATLDLTLANVLRIV